jgi:hypothetical protein
MAGYGNYNTRCFHTGDPDEIPIRKETFEAMVTTCWEYQVRLEVGRR